MAPGDTTTASDEVNPPREADSAGGDRAGSDPHVIESREDTALAGEHQDVPEGPFSSRQLFRIDDALSAADGETGYTFSVYVGDLTEPVRDYAERLHDQLAAPADSVLLAISPNQRVLEIVTGEHTIRRLPNRICSLAALSMTAAFAGGDLAGGIVTGLRMLADQAR